MNYLLIEQADFRNQLKPFTFTRPIAEIRVGILTIREKWEKHLDASLSYISTPTLSGKYPAKTEAQNILINSSVCPTPELVSAIQLGASLKKEGVLISAAATEEEIGFFDPKQKLEEAAEYDGEITMITQSWHIFQNNAAEIKNDFALITTGRNSQHLNDPHTKAYGEKNIFIEEGASIKAAILNAENGPIYIGKNAQIHEGAIIKGPFAMLNNAHVNMEPKLRGIPPLVLSAK